MRLSCGFAGANEDSQGILAARYHLNDEPGGRFADRRVAARCSMRHDGHDEPVAAGPKLPLEVAWPTCPLTDVCGDGICGADETLMSCPADCKNAARAAREPSAT